MEITQTVPCNECGSDLQITEDGIEECSLCAWFAATFQPEPIDFAAEQARTDELDAAWLQDAETFSRPAAATV